MCNLPTWHEYICLIDVYKRILCLWSIRRLFTTILAHSALENEEKNVDRFFGMEKCTN